MKRLLELFDSVLAVTAENHIEQTKFLEDILIEMQQEAAKFNPADYSEEERKLISDKAKEAYAYLDKLQDDIFKDV